LEFRPGNLTPLINRRTDGYGGSTEQRARFPAEVVSAIRDAVPAEVPIVVKMNADDGFSGGLHIDEALRVAKLLVAAGADAIVPSFGYTSLNGFGMLRGDVPLAQMAEAMPNGSKCLVRLLGRFLVPTIPYEHTFLLDLARRFVDALRGSGAMWAVPIRSRRCRRCSALAARRCSSAGRYYASRSLFASSKPRLGSR